MQLNKNWGKCTSSMGHTNTNLATLQRSFITGRPASPNPSVHARLHRFWKSRLPLSLGATASNRDGSVRRERIVLRRRELHKEMLSHFARRVSVDPAVLAQAPTVDAFRFPTQEFRSLALNVVGKMCVMDRGLWNRSKVPLCQLLLVFAEERDNAQAAAINTPHAGVSTHPEQQLPLEASAGGKLPPQEGSCSAAAQVPAADGLASNQASSECQPQLLAVAGMQNHQSLNPGLTALATAASDHCLSRPEAAVTAVTDTQPSTDSPDPIIVSATCLNAPSATDSATGSGTSSTAVPPTPFARAVEEVVDCCLDRDRQSMQKLMDDARIPDDQKSTIRGKFEARRRAMTQQAAAWCRDVVRQPGFAVIRPLLKQVLDLEPLPLFEQSGRDGGQTESLMAQLIERELPAGWSLYSGARLLKIDGEPFPNQKFLKGEADLLLVDPDGVVQALMEVKTASGNLFLALYEDVIRFLALMDRVRGHLVTFSLADNTRRTLQFSAHLKPVYVLGCELHPDDIEAVARNAQGKLLAMEVGRLLSSQVDAWGSIRVSDISPSTATLQLCAEALPPLRANVCRYFETLAGCEIYTLQQSAWSQREALEADALLEQQAVARAKVCKQ